MVGLNKYHFIQKPSFILSFPTNKALMYAASFLGKLKMTNRWCVDEVCICLIPASLLSKVKKKTGERTNRIYIVTVAMVLRSNNCHLSEAIQNLPLELWEMILTKHTRIPGNHRYKILVSQWVNGSGLGWGSWGAWRLAFLQRMVTSHVKMWEM